MNYVIRRSIVLTASAFLILMISSSAFAFPSVHTSEIIQGNWTYGGGVYTSVYVDAGESYYPIERAFPMIDDLPNDQQAPAAVPEPATVALMAVGLLGLGLLQRRRRNKTA